MLFVQICLGLFVLAIGLTIWACHDHKEEIDPPVYPH